MLCIKIWCEDSTEHIQVSSRCDEFIEVSCEVDELITIWSDLCERIEVSSEDVSDHIYIYSDWYPSIEIWASFVCHIGEWRPVLEVQPKKINFPCIGSMVIKTMILSNINWNISEK